MCLIPVTRPYLFFLPTLNFFSIWVKKLVRKFRIKKVDTKIYLWLSTAFMCIKPLCIAAMLHFVCCLQYIQSLVLHTRAILITQTTVYIEITSLYRPSLNIKKKSLPTLPIFLGACHRNQTYIFIWPNLGALIVFLNGKLQFLIQINSLFKEFAYQELVRCMFI